MIISHKYKFIFVKTRKTAGTSLEIYLSRHCDAGDVVTPIFPHVEPHAPRNYEGTFNPLTLPISAKCFTRDIYDLKKRRKFYNHMPAHMIKRRVSRQVWTEYFKFAVERNPWDKSLSHYYRVRNRPRYGGVRKLTFDEYLQQRNFCFNWPLYMDMTGSYCIADKIIRYERLETELQRILGDLGIPFAGDLGAHAKSEERTDRRPYQEALTQKQAMVIRDAFKKEIDLLGYEY